MEQLRIGVLGAARIAQRGIVEPAHETGHRLVAVAARDRGRAEAFAARHGFERVLDSYLEVVSDPEVDVIYNPLANSLHGPWNLAAAAAGKHVLTEKPFASNAVEAAEVRDAGAAAGVVVMEGFHYLYHPVMRRMLHLVDSGELGDMRHVEAYTLIPPPPDHDARWHLAMAGGALMDVGCYGLHAHQMLAPWAGGMPRPIAAAAGERTGFPAVDEWLDAELEFPSGATGEVHCSMADDWCFTCRIVGSRGEATAASFVQPQWDDRVLVKTPAGERTEELGRRSSYTFQLEAFAAHLREGTPVPTLADTAVTTMELIDTCYELAGFAPRPAGPTVIR